MQQTIGAKYGKINVCARLRPIISEDFQRANVVKREPEVCVHCHKDGQSIKLLQDSFHHKQYRVDHTLDASATQVDAYNTALKPVVYDVLKGYNGTALVYGPTASGKTYTMFGNDLKVGIAHFAVNDIFSTVSRYEEQELVAKVYISFYQIHLEQVYDLLTTSNTATLSPLSIREGEQGVFVEGLQQYFVKDKDTAYEIIKQGLANRRVQSTTHNIRSSRSHAILQFHLDMEVEEPSSSSASTGIATESRHILRRRVLTLVDLAGSERVPSYNKPPQSASGKQLLQEAIVINKSIAALGNVVSALANNTPSTHIPYRECKLTRLLALCLDGSMSRIVIIVHLNPCTYAFDESASTLKFATRAKLIRKGNSSISLQPMREVAVTSEVLPYFEDQQQGDEQSMLDGLGQEIIEEGTVTDASSIMPEPADVSSPRFSMMMQRNLAMNFGYQQRSSPSAAVAITKPAQQKEMQKAEPPRMSPPHRSSAYSGPYPTPIAVAPASNEINEQEGQGQGQGQQFNLRDFLRACTIANRIASKTDSSRDLYAVNNDDALSQLQHSQGTSSFARNIAPSSPMAATGASLQQWSSPAAAVDNAASPLKAMNGSNLSLLSAYSLPNQYPQEQQLSDRYKHEQEQEQQSTQEEKQAMSLTVEFTAGAKPMQHTLKAPVYLTVSTPSANETNVASKPSPVPTHATVEVQTVIVRSIDSDMQTEEVSVSSQGTQTFALAPTPRQRFFDGSLNDFEAFVAKPALDMSTQTNPALLVSSFYGRDEDQAELTALSHLDPLEVACLIIELRQKVRQQNDEIARLQELVLN